MTKNWAELSGASAISPVIGYRMERDGKLFIRFAGGDERQATEDEIRKLIETRPDLLLQLAWRA